MIVEYDTQWHARILQDHLDEAACKKIVGYETDYTEAMRRLETYIMATLRRSLHV